MTSSQTSDTNIVSTGIEKAPSWIENGLNIEAINFTRQFGEKLASKSGNKKKMHLVHLK